MSKLVLERDKSYKGEGTVLFSQGTGGLRPTGVFAPSSEFLGRRQELTVLLWFHGHYVRDARFLFFEEETKLLQALLDAKKNVLLVAPWLGWYQSDTQSNYNARVLGGGKTTETYLDQVLDALYDWYLSGLIDIDLDTRPPARFQIADLYLAGHSGGGGGITSAVAALGGYKDKLRQIWGFDCLYGSGETWYAWARAQKGVPLYFYYGRGTRPAFNGDVLGFWNKHYGTPRRPVSTAARLPWVHLAPALPGTSLDSVAFQSPEEIRAKSRPGNRYEEVRAKVDPLVENTGQYWSTLMSQGLKGHYEVVSELLGPRIRQSLP